MAQYRTQVKIIADVLNTAKELNSEGDGVGITALLRKANMSYGRISKLVTELVGSGLLEELNGDKTSKYVITAKGMQFLVAYQGFEDFAGSFGLRL